MFAPNVNILQYIITGVPKVMSQKCMITKESVKEQMTHFVLLVSIDPPGNFFYSTRVLSLLRGVHIFIKTPNMKAQNDHLLEAQIEVMLLFFSPISQIVKIQVHVLWVKSDRTT
jgi:hypothetical protein